MLSLVKFSVIWLLICGCQIANSTETLCYQSELLRPCTCTNETEFMFVQIDCQGDQPLDLKTVFGRLPPVYSKNTNGHLFLNNTSVESIEFNSTGNTIFRGMNIRSVNLTRIHEGAFIGTEKSLKMLRIYLGEGNQSRYAPDALAPPYHWLGLFNRMPALSALAFIGPFGNLHLPNDAFKGLELLGSALIRSYSGRITLEESLSKTFVRNRRLWKLMMIPLEQVPANFLTELQPSIELTDPPNKPLRLKLDYSQLTESSFDRRAFDGCCERPVHLELNLNPIRTLEESVFRTFFDGHPDNLVNVGETKIDVRSPSNAWWFDNEEYRLKVVNFTVDELGDVFYFPVEKLGRHNKWFNLENYPEANKSKVDRHLDDDDWDKLMTGLSGVDSMIM